jgi:uncharacterized protein DUF547
MQACGIDRTGATAQHRRAGRLAGLLIVLFAGAPVAALAGTAQDLFATHAEGTAELVDHSAWDRLLKAYVKPGADGLNRVDYAALKAGGLPALRDYVGTLEQADPNKLDRNEQFALLANLYNAKTLEIVASRYPVKSIKDISLGGGLVATVTGGPWKAKVTKLKGVELSLDDIEHGILRPIFKDPRVHYAVNCASIGCPNLAPRAWRAETLDKYLDAAARAFINHPRGVLVRPDGTLQVSSIYKWYKEDFGGTSAGVIEHLRRYAKPELSAKLAAGARGFDDQYDWTLNQVGGRV